MPPKATMTTRSSVARGSPANPQRTDTESIVPPTAVDDGSSGLEINPQDRVPQLSDHLAEVERLETLHALLLRKRELEEAIGQIADKSTSDRHRRSSSTSSERGQGPGEIKVEVPTFKAHYNIQQRQTWLNDLQDMFIGAPRKYGSDERKILGATNRMSSDCRERWRHYVEEKAEPQRTAYKTTWDLFEKWTLTLLHNSATLQADVATSLQEARQGPNQTPSDFNSYLLSLERHFEAPSEDQRALNFFTKLQLRLRARIQNAMLHLPKNRDEMVSTAMHYWNLIQTESGTKNYPPRSSNKRHHSPDHQGYRKRTNFNGPSSNSGRGRGWNRGSFRGRGSDRNPNNKPYSNRREFGAKPQDRQQTDGATPPKSYSCFTCGSSDHWRNECPQNSTKVQSTPARSGKARGSM
jgi:hypothetical protein